MIARSLRPIAISFALLAAVMGSLLAAPGPDGLLGAFLAALMLAIAVTDTRRYIIPNELTGAAFACEPDGIVNASSAKPKSLAV